MIVVLTPNQDIVTGEVTGGATNWSVLVDANDATYVLVVHTYDFKLGFTTFVLPAGAVTKSAQLSIRGYNLGNTQPNTNTGPLTLLSSLRAPTGTQLGSFSLTVPGVAAATKVSAPTAIAANQAIVDGLQVWYHCVEVRPLPGAPAMRLALTEMSVTVVAATQPVVVVGPPAGGIVTANPVLSWTYTGDVDADSAGRQTRYHARVFTDAQFGAPGFNPATSPAAYDSGDVVSDVSSALIGPLGNLTVFKAYVRAAQNVNGAPHWSLWDDGAVFNTNTDPPVVATLTAVPDNDSGFVTITATSDPAKPDWTHIDVERSTDNVTWQPVRGAYASAVTAVVSETVIDWEQPEGVPLWYRARGLIISGGVTLSQGDWTTTGPVVWSASGCGEWLRNPEDPTGGVQVDLIVDEGIITTEHRVGLLAVIGRSSPVAVWDVADLGTGEMSVATRTFADGERLQALVRDSVVLLYQGRHNLGHPYRWMVVTNHTTSRLPINDPHWYEYREFDITYAVVDPPPVLS